MSLANHQSILTPPTTAGDGQIQPDVADELLMQRLEIDLLRRQAAGLPIERLIEGFVPSYSLEIHMARYRFAAMHMSGRLLDMASGAGHGSNYLVSYSPSNSVLGIDVDAATVRYATLKYPRAGLTFECRDACEPWTSETFDGIASFETIEHVPRPDAMLDNVVRMLKPDGCFVVSTPVRSLGTLSDKPRWQFHEREWSVDEFRELLSQYFNDVTIYGQQWELRQRFGFIAVGKKAARRLARLSGIDRAILDRLPFDAFDMSIGRKMCVADQPGCMICVCRDPHPANDPDVVQRAAYGTG